MSSQRCCSSESGSRNCTGVAILDSSPLFTKSLIRDQTFMSVGVGCFGGGSVARFGHLGSFWIGLSLVRKQLKVLQARL